MPESTTQLDTIRDWLDEEYNRALSTYMYDNYVRLTNGGAAMYVDIYVANGTTFTLEGERYGETINKACDATKDALLDTLSKTI